MVPRNEIRAVADKLEVACVQTLMREYGKFLAHHPAGPEHFCLSGLEAELDRLPEPYTSPGVLLLAFVEGEPAGCVALRELPSLEPDSSAFSLELRRLWVRPPFRRLGLGRDLVQAALRHARASGAQSVYLDTVPAAMPEANRLYSEFGFKEIEPYSDVRVPGIAFFRLTLAQS